MVRSEASGGRSALAGCRPHGHFVHGLLALTLLALVGLGAGCGKDGGGSGSSSTVRVEGAVQKGLFLDLVVTAYPLEVVTGQPGDPIVAVIEDQNYSVAVPEGSPILLEATGSYLDDLSSQPVIVDEPMMAVVDPARRDHADQRESRHDPGRAERTRCVADVESVSQ